MCRQEKARVTIFVRPGVQGFGGTSRVQHMQVPVPCRLCKRVPRGIFVGTRFQAAQHALDEVRIHDSKRHSRACSQNGKECNYRFCHVFIVLSEWLSWGCSFLLRSVFVMCCMPAWCSRTLCYMFWLSCLSVWRPLSLVIYSSLYEALIVWSCFLTEPAQSRRLPEVRAEARGGLIHLMTSTPRLH